MIQEAQSDLVDPLDRAPIGDMDWFHRLTGWSHDKISRLARQKAIPGAFKALPSKGSVWCFRKAKVIAWLESREVK
jgi:hypothetical protein